PPPNPPLFPYTTLFRSPLSAITQPDPLPVSLVARVLGKKAGVRRHQRTYTGLRRIRKKHGPAERTMSPPQSSTDGSPLPAPGPRSEEHTSELQSRRDLV